MIKLNMKIWTTVLIILKNDKVSLDTFEAFVVSNKDTILKYKLSGLKKEAEEMIIVKKIRDHLKIFKRINGHASCGRKFNSGMLKRT